MFLQLINNVVMTYILSLGVDGFCENAGRAPLNFSENAVGSCLLRLGLAELMDCNATRLALRSVSKQSNYFSLYFSIKT